MASSLRSVTFHPLPTSHPIEVIPSKSKGGCHFKIYEGRETVGFGYSDIKGQFVRESASVASILMKIGATADMIHCLATIAVYCRWSFLESTERTKASMEEAVYRKVAKDFRAFLSINTHDTRGLLINPAVIGKLTLVPDCDIITGARYFCTISDPHTIVNNATSQAVTIKMPNDNLALPDSVVVPNGPIKFYDSLTRRLVYVVLQYISNTQHIVTLIQTNQFNYLNASIGIHVPKHQRNSAAKTCRIAATTIANCSSRDSPKWDPIQMCLAYAFSGPYDPHTSSKALTVFKYGPGTIDLGASSGVFIYDESSHVYKIAGIPLTKKKTPKASITHLVAQTLEGFQIYQEVDDDLPTLSLRTLINRACDIPDGETANTVLAGRMFKVVRDRGIQYSRDLTLHRSMIPFSTHDVLDESCIVEGIFRKRKVDTQKEEVASKVRRLELAANSLNEEDIQMGFH